MEERLEIKISWVKWIWYCPSQLGRKIEKAEKWTKRPRKSSPSNYLFQMLAVSWSTHVPIFEHICKAVWHCPKQTGLLGKLLTMSTFCDRIQYHTDWALFLRKKYFSQYIIFRVFRQYMCLNLSKRPGWVSEPWVLLSPQLPCHSVPHLLWGSALPSLCGSDGTVGHITPCHSGLADPGNFLSWPRSPFQDET